MIVPNKLMEFLAHDLCTDRMLIPFFTAQDLLRLSECSKAMIKYRGFLSYVKLVSHPSFGSDGDNLKDGLYKLLGDETQEVGIRHLGLAHRSLVTNVLERLATQGCLDRLSTLDLGSIELLDEDIPAIRRVLTKGFMSGLEGLKIRGRLLSFTALGVSELMRALGEGSCPNLRRLYLAGSRGPNGSSSAIAAALKSGHCSRLQELHLSSVTLRGGEAIAHALHFLPNLLVLALSDCALDSEGGIALASALESGACPLLEEFILSGNHEMGDWALSDILHSLGKQQVGGSVLGEGGVDDLLDTRPQ